MCQKDDILAILLGQLPAPCHAFRGRLRTSRVVSVTAQTSDGPFGHNGEDCNEVLAFTDMWSGGCVAGGSEGFGSAMLLKDFFFRVR